MGRGAYGRGQPHPWSPLHDAGAEVARARGRKLAALQKTGTDDGPGPNIEPVRTPFDGLSKTVQTPAGDLGKRMARFIRESDTAEPVGRGVGDVMKRMKEFCSAPETPKAIGDGEYNDLACLFGDEDTGPPDPVDAGDIRDLLDDDES